MSSISLWSILSEFLIRPVLSVMNRDISPSLRSGVEQVLKLDQEDGMFLPLEETP